MLDASPLGKPCRTEDADGMEGACDAGGGAAELDESFVDVGIVCCWVVAA